MNLNVIWVTLIAFVIGILWYSPLMFGKAWMKEAGPKARKAQPTAPAMIVGFLSNVVYMLILSTALAYTTAKSFADGVVIGLFIWAGFLAMPMLGSVLWEKKSIRFYAINVSYWLVVTVVGSGLFSVWR